MTSTLDDARELLAKEQLLCEEADKAYFKAGNTSDPQHWLEASLLARQHRNALAALRAAPPTRRQPECAQVAREIVTDWLGAFDPPPQIDSQQSEMLQAAIVSALRAESARCDAESASLIQRWRREANNFRTVAREMFDAGDDEEGTLCDVEASRLDVCADELTALTVSSADRGTP